MFHLQHAPVESALAPAMHPVAAASFASTQPSAAESGQAIEHRKAPFLILIKALVQRIRGVGFFKAAPVSDRAVARWRSRSTGSLFAGALRRALIRSIRALPDLCVGIVSRRLETLSQASPLLTRSPGTPGAFFNSASRLFRRQLLRQLWP